MKSTDTKHVAMCGSGGAKVHSPHGIPSWSPACSTTLPPRWTAVHAAVPLRRIATVVPEDVLFSEAVVVVASRTF